MSALPSQPSLEEGNFKLVAKRKEVVVNEKVEEANWVRKRNAMSKNEIKRQSELLRSLPMIQNQVKETNTNETMSPPKSSDRSQTSPKF